MYHLKVIRLFKIEVLIICQNCKKRKMKSENNEFGIEDDLLHQLLQIKSQF
jgi:hypothetical protein